MAFHYASSSPWPMLPALHDWISSKGEFPRGSFHLKPFRFELFEPWGVDITLFNLFKDPTQYKVRSYAVNFPCRSALSHPRRSQHCLIGCGFACQTDRPDQRNLARLSRATVRPGWRFFRKGSRGTVRPAIEKHDCFKARMITVVFAVLSCMTYGLWC